MPIKRGDVTLKASGYGEPQRNPARRLCFEPNPALYFRSPGLQRGFFDVDGNCIALIHGRVYRQGRHGSDRAADGGTVVLTEIPAASAGSLVSRRVPVLGLKRVLAVLIAIADTFSVLSNNTI